MSAGSPARVEARTRRSAGRRLLALLLTILAFPSLFVHAHLALDHHGTFHPVAHADADAAGDEDRHDPGHPADDHTSQQRLKYTLPRIAKSALDPVALPPALGWEMVPPTRLSDAPAADSRSAWRPSHTAAWPRGPPSRV